MKRGGQLGIKKDHAGLRAGLNGGDGVLVKVLTLCMSQRGKSVFLKVAT